MTEPLDLRSPRAQWVIIRAQENDRAALDQILHAVQGPLLAHVTALLGDEDLAEDVLQDALLLIARKLKWLRDPRWFRAWAYRIATRESMRQARKQHRRVALMASRIDELTPAQQSSDLKADDDAAFDTTLIARVPQLLTSLPPAAQTALRMHYLEGMTLREIAESLEAPLGTIKSRVAWGLGLLRAVLKKD